MQLLDSLDYDDPGHVEIVRALDPLGADGACRRLPELNARADVPAMVATLRSLLPNDVSGFTAHECLAVMRDLGIFLGSVKRHGVEPEPLVPEMTPVLLELGARTDLVPRDTILHYTTWNPVGERERRYTDDSQETYLQDSVRMVFDDIQTGLACGESLHDLEPRDPEFAATLDEFARRLGSMVDSMELVIKHVTPAYFARGLRPYLEAVDVAGRRDRQPPGDVLDVRVQAAILVDDQDRRVFRVGLGAGEEALDLPAALGRLVGDVLAVDPGVARSDLLGEHVVGAEPLEEHFGIDAAHGEGRTARANSRRSMRPCT